MKLAFAILTLIVFTHASYAQQNSQRPQRSPVVVGFAYGDRTKTYKEADESDIFIPFFSFEWKRIFLRGPRLGVDLYRGFPNINLYLTPQFLDLIPVPGTYSEGLKERKRTIHIGLGVDIPLKKYVFSLNTERDLSVRHDSIIPTISVRRTFFFKKFNLMITPSLGYQYASKSFSQYYFSVSTEEARADRPAYSLNKSEQYLIWNASHLYL